MRKALISAAREGVGLLVDDGVAALGTVLAVVVAALLAGVLGGDALGWSLFVLVWAALTASLVRAARVLPQEPGRR